jgi:hypothetical protein
MSDMLEKVWHTPETQASVTTGLGLTYFLTLQEWIAALTIVLLVGQLGLLAVKYYKVWLEWRAKRGTKE